MDRVGIFYPNKHLYYPDDVFIEKNKSRISILFLVNLYPIEPPQMVVPKTII